MLPPLGATWVDGWAFRIVPHAARRVKPRLRGRLTRSGGGVLYWSHERAVPGRALHRAAGGVAGGKGRPRPDVVAVALSRHARGRADLRPGPEPRLLLRQPRPDARPVEHGGRDRPHLHAAGPVRELRAHRAL